MPNKHATLADLFTATADAIRFKTGSTGVIVADNFPEAIRAMNVGAESNKVDITSMNILNLTLPMGRVKGDLDGDGKITHHNTQETEVDLSTDSGILFSYNSDADIELNEIQQWCADTNSDDEINNMDSSYLFGHVSGVLNMFCDSIDAGVNPEYYNNWTFMKVDDLNGFFYRDIEVPGMTTNSVASLAVSDNFEIFDGVECMDGVARIKAKMPPIEPMGGFLVWDQNGDSGNIGELRFCSGILPLGRMLGDIDGDGLITQEDYSLALEIGTNISEPSDEIAQWCADINGDGVVNSLDAMSMLQHVENENTENRRNIFCDAIDNNLIVDYYNNWSYEKIDALTGYFYYDIPNLKVTSNSSAILIASSHEDCFDGVECFDGKLRVKANIPPIEPVDFDIIYSVYKSNGVVTTLATLPRGRMLGDIDGDGEVTSEDYNIAMKYIAEDESVIIDEVGLWCLDAYVDEKYDSKDFIMIGQHIEGGTNLFNQAKGAVDYYNNWRYEPIDALTGYFYYEVQIAGAVPGRKAFLFVSSNVDCFDEVECFDGTIRIKANKLPLEDVVCNVVLGPVGSTLVDDGFETVYTDIPMGRMKGDIDGDGNINATDYEYLQNHISGGNEIIDEIQLWCLDINSDDEVDTFDTLPFRYYLEGTKSIFYASSDAGVNPEYYNNWSYVKVDDLNGYFYHDVPIEGMTTSSTAVLLASDYADCFEGIECMNGVARIKATRCPIGRCKGTILWKQCEKVKSELVVPMESLELISLEDIDAICSVM